MLHDSAQSNGALSNGFNADSGVQWNNLTVITFTVVARTNAGREETFFLMNHSLARNVQSL